VAVVIVGAAIRVAVVVGSIRVGIVVRVGVGSSRAIVSRTVVISLTIRARGLVAESSRGAIVVSRGFRHRFWFCCLIFGFP